MTDTRTLLLIDSDPAHAALFQAALLGAAHGPFQYEWALTLAEGLECLKAKGIWAIFVNFSLPDSRGLGTFERLSIAAPGIPVLVLGGMGDVAVALEVLRRGAQDFLLEEHLDASSFLRSLCNIAQRKTADDISITEKDRAQVTLNSIGDAVLSIDIEGNVTYLNQVAEALTGWTRQEALGKPVDEIFKIVDGSTRETSPNPLRLAVQKNKTVTFTPNCILIRRDGHESAIEDSAAPIHDRLGLVTGAVIVFHDVSRARALALEVSHLAQYDNLTNLPNRILLKDRLNQAISACQRNGTQLAVLFVDLDGFKRINDSLGHAVGDKLLQSVGRRLLACVRNSDTVSRLGGDEFVVLLSELKHGQDASISARKILSALIVPHDIGEHSHRVTASIGVTIYPGDGHEAEMLIKNADLAMYQAKEVGRNNFKFFEKGMNVRAIERQAIEEGLRYALEREEFLLHYQPQIDLKSGEITAVEALVRWQHPQRGLVGPMQFVSIAEDCGLMAPIDRWVLREACRQARAWQDAGLRPIGVAVNVSAVEFRGDDFIEDIRATLEETRLDPRHLELELTERVVMQRVESTAPTLQKLKAMGMRLAIDDFGTGYSSLSYLRQFPIDTLKVDQSFVSQIDADTNDSTIISSVIGMGKRLKHRVVAEGVETAQQLAFLQAHDCDEGQGYYFSRPVTAPQVAALLETRIPRVREDRVNAPRKKPRSDDPQRQISCQSD